jgi:hypothetical protein
MRACVGMLAYRGPCLLEVKGQQLIGPGQKKDTAAAFLQTAKTTGQGKGRGTSGTGRVVLCPCLPFSS